jgi:hypothetical protein
VRKGATEGGRDIGAFLLLDGAMKAVLRPIAGEASAESVSPFFVATSRFSAPRSLQQLTVIGIGGDTYDEGPTGAWA